jgi:antitoxin CptB
MGAAAPLHDPDGAALRRLRWRARRGMLENDLILQRFLDRHGAALEASDHAALGRLLDLPDGELLDLLLERAPAGPWESDPLTGPLLARLRAA